MPTLRLKIQYNKNDETVISPNELLERYMFGIPLCSEDGKVMSKRTIKTQIANAQKKVENLFSLKLCRQVVEESRDFVREEFQSWGHIKTTYPVFYVSDLKGYINDICQINYPMEWLSIKRTTEGDVFRNIYLIPNTGSNRGATMTQNSLVYNGMSPHLGWFGQKFIPNYWRMKYITGWNEIPADLEQLISKYAAINVLNILGDILYGVGISSITITLDGVSQNTPLTRSGNAGLFGGRIKQYTEEINSEISNLKYQYRGITFEVL